MSRLFDRPSKRFKDAAASARRIATALKALADSRDLERADEGLLLKAAEVLAVHAAAIAHRAKKAKAEEDDFERRRSAALTVATKEIRAWPITTTLDKIALCAMAIGGLHWIDRDISHIRARNFPRREVRWGLNDATEQTLRELPASIAYDVAKGRAGPILTLLREKLERLDALHGDPQIIATAARLDALYAEYETATEESA